MRRWLRFAAAGVLLAVCLSGCGLLSGDTSSAGPTSAATASLNLETRQRMTTDCMDLWLNTEAPQDVIDEGMGVTDGSGATAVIQDSSGMYHVQFGTGALAAWAGMGDNPWSDIFIAISNGVGCPYDPVVKAKLNQETQDCLQVWVNTEASQAAIDDGLIATDPDGVPVSPVLTLGSDGQYRVDFLSDNFQAWTAGAHDYFVPWGRIYTRAIANEGCPYGPSPEQSPTATAS